MKENQLNNINNRIIVENISKKFQIGFKKHQGALERVISLFSGKEPKRTIHALEDVSFTAGKGEIVGIIGENGSGKSTLLRIIAGIYKQDEGKIITNGKIISLINLKLGLHHRNLTKFDFPSWSEAEQNWKIKFGWRNLQGFGTVKFLLVSLDRGWILVQRSTKPKNPK